MNTMLKIFLLALMIIAILTTTVLANGGYQIDWWTVDNGGGISSSEPYTLQGSIGQPDAASAASQSGSFTLDAGFWVRGISTLLDFLIHLPLVFR